MKNFSTQTRSILTLSLFITVFAATSLKAYPNLMILDTIPKEKDVVTFEPFTRVEKTPEFPGGEEAFLSFLNENIKYPAEAKVNLLTGTVVIEFVVDKSGKLLNPEVVREIGGGCDEEALRVVKLMPDWIPGYQNGKAVKVKHRIPIRFRL